MRKAREEGRQLHLKMDKTFVDLVRDYHDVSSNDIITYFHDLMKQMVSMDGNVVNKEKASVPIGHRIKNRWKTVDSDLHLDYDAYCLRGFYPGSKIPFKMTGVKRTDFACFVVKIGDKDKELKFNQKVLTELEQTVAESILLDKEVDEDKFYKPTAFRCMTPKGMDKLEKSKDGKES